MKLGMKIISVEAVTTAVNNTNMAINKLSVVGDTIST
jgi:hypothetical protein